MSSAPQPRFSADFAVGFRNMIVPAIARERETAKRVIAAIPAKNHDYKPDPKSRTALEIATHLVESDVWFMTSIAARKFDWSPENQLKTFTSPQEAIAWYDKNFPAPYEAVMKLTGPQLLEIVDFFGMQFPNFCYINFSQIHGVHHRGQLSTYLRAMGGKVPDIYGGSADEAWDPNKK